MHRESERDGRERPGRVPEPPRHGPVGAARSRAAPSWCTFPVMPYDSGLVERVADALAPLGVRGARQRSMFGGRGFMLGKQTFVIVWGEGIIVKVPRGEYEVALAEPGATPFTPGGGRPMSTWVVVTAEAVADDPELQAWVARGIRAVA
ncbi:hypothetical protein tb265_16390 [Gemmatimonadetes bacterium T265]|nr:hypothetical protein tb265_16390 [Gemmatimonadetes bacterium T265]